MTEHDCLGLGRVNDGIAWGVHDMDGRSAQLIESGRILILEGALSRRIRAPYPISYRSLTPQAAECKNLLVAGCLSASHVAWTSLGNEPVFMMLGEAAGTAAASAARLNIAVQRVDVKTLQAKLKLASLERQEVAPRQEGFSLGLVTTSSIAAGDTVSGFRYSAGEDWGDQDIAWAVNIPVDDGTLIFARFSSGRKHGQGYDGLEPQPPEVYFNPRWSSIVRMLAE